MTSDARIRQGALLLAGALVVLGAFVPAASARQLDRKSETTLVPSVYPFGNLRKGERIVSLSARTEAGIPIEVILEAICFDRRLRSHIRKRTVTGTGRIRVRVRRPRGRFKSCSAGATVRVHPPPLPESAIPPPIRLGAALYARR